MLALKVAIARFVDPSQPGFVEASLLDAHGREWKFIEKVPVITDAELDANSSYPQPGWLACTLITSRIVESGREIVTVSTRSPWDIESTSGETTFEVYRDQLSDS